MLCRISSRTRLSQPGRAVSERFLQTSQTEEASDARPMLRMPPRISVAIGQVRVTAKPARMTAETRASQASGFLFAKTTTILPSAVSDSEQDWKARAIPSSYTFFDVKEFLSCLAQ